MFRHFQRTALQRNFTQVPYNEATTRDNVAARQSFCRLQDSWGRAETTMIANTIKKMETPLFGCTLNDRGLIETRT
jgi:hypothetical protein